MKDLVTNSKDQTRNDSKRSDIISIATRLFLCNGTKMISVDQICAKVDISKMTFYRKFTSKLDLVLHVEMERQIKGRAVFRQVMAKPLSFKDKVSELILLQLEELSQLSEAYINEVIEGESEELKNILTIFSQQNISDFHQDIKDAQTNGELTSNINPNMVVYLLRGLSEKLKDPILNSLYPNKKDLIVDITSVVFRGILTK